MYYDLIILVNRLIKNVITLDRLRYYRYKLTIRSSVSKNYIILSSRYYLLYII